MADFVIKPGAGASNRLILQAQDGETNVLTTSASGVTLASATLNSPTLVTPALGTPASGVLTNATFPAGHVLQCKHFVNGYNQTISASGYTNIQQSSGVDWTVGITPSATSSKIHLISSIIILTDYSSGPDSRGHLRIYQKIGSATATTVVTLESLFGDYDRGNSGNWSQKTVTYHHQSSPATLNEVVFTFGVAENNVDTSTTHGATDNANKSTVTVMEIAG